MLDQNLRVALVHDYLKEYGGAERVLEALHEIFPQAPVFVAYFNPKGLGSQGEALRGWQIKTSFMQQIPFIDRLLSPLKFLAIWAFESFDLSGYDLVISSTNAYFAKAVITKPPTLHISYIHTPPRHLYGYTISHSYRDNMVTRFLGEILNHILRWYDFKISQRPDILIANSLEVQRRIKKFYRREAVVVYPPVGINQLLALNIKRQGERRYFLSVGRLVKGKGIDIIVRACNRLGMPLKVVGIGPLLPSLKLEAGNHQLIQFLGRVSDVELVKLYRGAIATIAAAQDEDFGIVPVESMASGTPVIALKSGGYLETVVAGKTGEFFDHPTQESLMGVLEVFDPKKYELDDLLTTARQFSSGTFKEEILKVINNNLNTG